LAEPEPVGRLQALDAIAGEADAVLAFRVADGSQELEPVFMRLFGANPGEPHETALISIEDQDGLSLGRYVVSRSRLDAALARIEDVEHEDEPTVVPAEWAGG
jgi:hypothetical protein